MYIKALLLESHHETTKEERASNHTYNTGFKINTERTKEQYKECDHHTSAFSEKYKYNFTVPKQSNFERYEQSTTRAGPSSSTSKQTNHNPDSNTKARKENGVNNERVNDEKLSRTKKRNKKNLRKQKSNENEHTNACNNSANSNQTINNAESQRNSNGEDFQHTDDIIAKVKIFLEKGFRLTKDIVIVVGCLLIMVAWIVIKVFWHIGLFLLKFFLFIVVSVFVKCYQFLSSLNEKYCVIGRIRNLFSTSMEIIHLVTGVNIASLFKKNPPGEQHSDSEDVEIELPTSSHLAVEYLLKQKENKPYRTLYLTRNASDANIKSNYRKLALLVHPDKCEDSQSDEAFKVLDAAFKKISDPTKRQETADEEERQKQWDAFNKQYSDGFQKMFDEMVNTIPCSSCGGRHKRTLIKDRDFLSARFCGDCNTKHSANDGDIWAETNMFGLQWTCYVCLDGEIYELTEWAKCQNLKNAIPVNSHRVPCRLGGMRQNRGRRRHKDAEYSETTNQKKKRGRKGRRGR